MHTYILIDFSAGALFILEVLVIIDNMTMAQKTALALKCKQTPPCCLEG